MLQVKEFNGIVDLVEAFKPQVLVSKSRYILENKAAFIRYSAIGLAKGTGSMHNVNGS